MPSPCFFGHVSGSAGLKGRGDEIELGVHADDEDGNSRKDGAQLTGQFDSASIREADVDDGQVWFKFFGLTQAIGAGAGLAGHVEI